MGELAEQHRDQLGPAAKTFGGFLRVVFLDQRPELGSGKVLEQLIEQARDLYDWIALLWAAFGEVSGKELLANVNYRRALPLISDCKNLFWTRVNLECFWPSRRASAAGNTIGAEYTNCSTTPRTQFLT
jgi:hypothetical protein